MSAHNIHSQHVCALRLMLLIPAQSVHRCKHYTHAHCTCTHAHCTCIHVHCTCTHAHCTCSLHMHTCSLHMHTCSLHMHTCSWSPPHCMHRYVYWKQLDVRLEYALLASSFLKAALTFSSHLPTSDLAYATFEPNPFKGARVKPFPGLDLFSDIFRCSPSHLLATLRWCSHELVSRGHALKVLIKSISTPSYLLYLTSYDAFQLWVWSCSLKPCAANAGSLCTCQ